MQWKATEEQIRLALAELPPEKTAQVQEYLEHNELGLAWKAMKELAEEGHIVGSEAEACFWRPMAKAACLMLEYGFFHRT